MAAKPNITFQHLESIHVDSPFYNPCNELYEMIHALQQGHLLECQPHVLECQYSVRRKYIIRHSEINITRYKNLGLENEKTKQKQNKTN